MLAKLTPAVNFINVLRQKITKPNVTREIRFHTKNAREKCW